MTKGQFSPVDLSKEDVTPITHEKINTVEATHWDSLSMTELHDELGTLRNRMQMMLDMCKPDIARQINSGITQLEAIITRKQSNVDPIL